MLSFASERLTTTRAIRDSARGGALALLVQAVFVAMLVLSSRHPAPLPKAARETILLLHALPNVPSQTIDARGAPSRVRRPAIPLIIPAMPSFKTVPALAPPSGIAGFGRSLFGCAPEHYADLPPDEKAHCPKPGEGLATNQPPDLLNPPKSHAKDEAMWQEQWAEDHWVPAVCPPGGWPHGKRSPTTRRPGSRSPSGRRPRSACGETKAPAPSASAVRRPAPARCAWQDP